MKRLILLTALLVIAGCGGTPTRLAQSPAELQPFEPELTVSSLWVAEVDRGVGDRYLKLPPLLLRDRVFTASHAGTVSALSTASGQPLWRRKLGTIITAGPGDGGDLLLFGADAEVFALKKEDGALLWRAPLSSEVLAAPVRLGDRVIARTVDGQVIALRVLDGAPLWRYNQSVPTLSLRGMSRPVAVGGSVLVGFANGRLVALDADKGQPQWETTIALPRGRTELERMTDIDAEIEISRGVVYVVSYQGRLNAIALGSGQLLWSRDIPSHTGMALDEETLYVSDSAGAVWALSRHNGGTLWKQDALSGRQLGAPVLQGRHIVIGDYDGYLHWLATDDGRLTGRSRVEDWKHHFPVAPELPDAGYPEARALLAPPVVAEDRVYIIDQRGVLGAFQVSPADS